MRLMWPLQPCRRIHQNLHFPPITLCKNCTQMDELSNSEAWQQNPLLYPDRLLIDFCLWSIPLSSSSSLSLTPLDDSPSSHVSIIPDLSFATDQHKACSYRQKPHWPSVRWWKSARVCLPRGLTHTVTWSSVALYYMINSFPSFMVWVSVCPYMGRVFWGQRCSS